MSRWRPPLRIPKTPHRAGDRLVPVPGCGCETCVAERNRREADADVAHWQRVGEIVGIDDERESEKR